MNNLYGRLPVPNNFLSRVHIPHNYNSYPVPFIPMNLQNSQTNIQAVRQMCQESVKTWKHWQMLPSQTLMKIEKVI